MDLLIDGKWNEVKGQFLQKYANLTDNDLIFEKGKEDEFFGKLEQKLGKTKTEVRQEIQELISA